MRPIFCFNALHGLLVRLGLILLGLVAGTLPLSAQPNSSISGPALPTTAVPPLSPPAPAISFGSTAANAGSGLSSTNFTVGNLAALLQRAQGDLQQLLPVLSSFNNNFAFVTAGINATNAPVSGGAANLGSNLGGNVAANFGNNLSMNTGANLGVPPSTMPVSEMLSNAFGFPPGLGVAPVTSDTLRALIVLQNDLERMLPTLNTLNGGNTNFVGVGLAPGFVAGAVTNVFTVPAAAISPTGR